MAAPTKRELIKLYEELKKELGHQPGAKQFVKFLGAKKIARRHLELVFGINAFSKLTVEAGDTPNAGIGSTPKKSKEALLAIYGAAVQEVGHHPSMVEWRHRKLSPSTSLYEKTFGNWTQLLQAFRDYAKDQPEWAATLSLLPLVPSSVSSANPAEFKVESTEKPHYTQFVPPILERLIHLAAEEGKSLEFEKKVNLAFQLLGFEVESLGQGSGRNPDGIACDLRNHYAIIIDAKSRRDGYSLGTDDRTFREYIESHRRRLEALGIKTLYLALVSGRFKNPTRGALDKIKKEGATAVLITAAQLIKMVGAKIELPHRFDLHTFKEKILFEGGELKDRSVDEFIEGMQSNSSQRL